MGKVERGRNGFRIANGIFKHKVYSSKGHLVCLKLYSNGWSISTWAGTLKTDIRLNGNEIDISPVGKVKKGRVVLSSSPSGPFMVDRIEVETEWGKMELAGRKDTDIEILLDGRRYGYIRDIAGKGAEYDLPESVPLLDAAIIYTIGMIAVRYSENTIS